MDPKEQRSALRAAVYRGDRPAVVHLLQGGAGAYDDALQLAGDGLSAAVMQHVEGASELGEEDEDAADDPERWLPVHNEGSLEAYRDMESFIASVEDPGRAERLARAIAGRGAFRRFKDELARWPGELERWYALSEERQRGRARTWLTAAGCRVLPAAGRDP